MLTFFFNHCNIYSHDRNGTVVLLLAGITMPVVQKSRGDVLPEEECCRQASEVVMRRTHRDASTVSYSLLYYDDSLAYVWLT